jgi:hypothetical protein
MVRFTQQEANTYPSARVLDPGCVISERDIEQATWISFDHGEASAAWRLLLFNWRVLASLTGVLVAGLIATEFYIEPAGYLVAFGIAGLYWRFGLLNAGSTRWNPRISCALVATAQMILALSVMTPLTYLAMSIDLPLQDTALLAWDRTLGLDFRSYLDFVNARPLLIGPLAFGYRSIGWQIFGIMIVLPLAGYYRRSAAAICAFTLALVATTCISAMVPAIGVYGVLGLHASDFPNIQPGGYYDTLRDAPLVRAGTLHGLNLLRLVGVLTFPSFHAASAALYLWALWPLRWLRLLLVPCNILMIAATPLAGGHYFVDVLAGIAVSAAAIAVTLRISHILSPKILA